LLAASPQERERLLAGRRAEDRKILLDNLRRYETMAPGERDYRLRSMELRFHLVTLMQLAPTNRTPRLQLVPPSERGLVEERLRIWDRLPPGDQKELLKLERLARVTSVMNPLSVRSNVALSVTASNQFRQMELGFDRLKGLSESKRERIQDDFTRLFELPDPAMAKRDLESLPFSSAEREQMEKTLERFRSLPKPQRDACIQNYRKLQQLPPDELRRFLKSAEEWQKMNAKDREEWRALVNKLPPMPPSPPGLGLPPRPSMSPALPRSVATAYTNR
jgi:hypothetical protein